jgi:hypothetical protein
MAGTIDFYCSSWFLTKPLYGSVESSWSTLVGVGCLGQLTSVGRNTSRRAAARTQHLGPAPPWTPFACFASWNSCNNRCSSVPSREMLSFLMLLHGRFEFLRLTCFCGRNSITLTDKNWLTSAQGELSLPSNGSARGLIAYRMGMWNGISGEENHW